MVDDNLGQQTPGQESVPESHISSTTSGQTWPEPLFVLPEVDSAALRRAREIARAARKQRWWLDKRNRGVCHYCGERFPPRKLSMDHIVPLCRGGRTTPGNVVAACLACNRSKDALTPAEIALRTSDGER